MTAIEWTDRTWNPIVGCSVVSPGCTNCYAMRMAARIETMIVGTTARNGGSPGNAPVHYEGLTHTSRAGGVWTGKVARAPDETLTAPLRWKKPSRIFVNSMGDLFHEAVPDAWIDAVFAVMALAERHTFQVLTKRADRMRAYMDHPEREALVMDAAGSISKETRRSFSVLAKTKPLPLRNVWLGVSAEDQDRANTRIPELLLTPAAVRFVSYEPALGPIDFTAVREPNRAVAYRDALRGCWRGEPLGQTYGHAEFPRLDWIIAGGESGRAARPPHPLWFRHVRDQCAIAGVPFFFKQWGEHHPSAEHDHIAMRCSDTPLAVDIRGDVEYRPFEAGWKLDDPASGYVGMCRLGKKRAGRELDGRTHDAMPEWRR